MTTTTTRLRLRGTYSVLRMSNKPHGMSTRERERERQSVGVYMVVGEYGDGDVENVRHVQMLFKIVCRS